ncbi:LURP-one-related/scramblase family protein [Streptomyces violascens]|uniref:UDP-N-acetylenolpyruvoylglucosamine reductase n=1 Tax=Streptomyces violascens TaxID=67381 RepID=A0ABQ3QS70_9ACTN|nr:LURP-one-related family protein [Streptomyces violascens]GGU48087.1 UDP-N-acetylenolpyruvoylglucosamine reductase [Streptomyces violascens]GHI40137.1 UDP-N-acetylenolpyruvoylglucosamine reductase [Streptomyces violascens]
MRYLVRDRMLAFHEEAWVENEHREKLFKVNRKLLRLRTTFDLVDTRGNQVARITKKVLTLHHTILIKQDGQAVGLISKRAFRLFGDRFKVRLRDGRQLRIAGNLWDREFDIRHGGNTLAHISRRWFTIRDAYAVDVMNERDATLLIIVAVCVDHILEDRKGERFTNL